MAEIEAFDPAELTDAELTALYALHRKVEEDAGTPDHLIPPRDEFVLDQLHTAATVRRHFGVIRDDGDIVGWFRLAWEDVESNRDHVSVDYLEVHPAHRRQGLGRRLLAAALGRASEFDPRILEAEPQIGGTGAAFAEAHGFECRMVAPENVLATAEVDRALMESWVKAAGERASDYELFGWDGPVPEEHLERFADLWLVMNTAPTEDLDWDDEVTSPERIRAWDGMFAARGLTPWVLVARHLPTDDWAGFTVLVVSPHWPGHAEQLDTGVSIAHRDRGLGRWLKAAMMLRLLDEASEVEYVSTWNAGSNEPMLAINHAMGFRPAREFGGYQAEASVVAAALAGDSPG